MRRTTIFTACAVLVLLSACCPAESRVPRKIINPVDHSTLVWIPAGDFTMGSRDGDPDELPLHVVHVEGFWMSDKEITNAQYALFLKATDSREPDLWDDPEFNGPGQPVIGVMWKDAVAYCEWAGGRLPTEAEWEYAASAGKGFPYGTATGAITQETANYGGATRRDAYRDTTSPVGTFPANPFGLYDMAGNAWEWTSSMWLSYPYSRDDGREDTEPNGVFRVMRGGCFHFGEFHCRTAARRRHRDHLHYDYVGFRMARTADDMPAEPSPGLAPEDMKLIDTLKGLSIQIEESSLNPAQKKEALAVLNKLMRRVKSALPEFE